MKFRRKIMEMVTVHLPADLYHDIETIASEQQKDVVQLLIKLLRSAVQQYEWRKGWQELRQLVQQDGKLPAEMSVDELVEQMRKIREEIFEAEYAHLYR
jgi:hypothetical protein